MLSSLKFMWSRQNFVAFLEYCIWNRSKNLKVVSLFGIKFGDASIDSEKKSSLFLSSSNFINFSFYVQKTQKKINQFSTLNTKQSAELFHWLICWNTKGYLYYTEALPLLETWSVSFLSPLTLSDSQSANMSPMLNSSW